MKNMYTDVRERDLTINESFICYEDEDILVTAYVHFHPNSTKVESILFRLINKGDTKYKYYCIEKCIENEFPYYHISLLNDAEEIYSDYLLTAEEIEDLDMAAGTRTLFRFNVINSEQIDEYVGLCKFTRKKPRSKDGYIIVSL